MSLKRRLLTLSLLVFVLALLAACGSQATPQASQPAAPAAPKATEAAKPAAAPTQAPAAAKQEPAKAGAKNTLIDIAVGDETDNGWNKAHIESTTKITKEKGWAYLAYKNLNPGAPAKPVCEIGRASGRERV